MLNKAILIGNLGADPETRFMQDGTCCCNLRLATTEKYKDKQGQQVEKTEWHRVVLWGKIGEIANQYLKKGARVYIEGKIETRKWQDKDGQDKYTTEIRANEMKMLGGNTDSAPQSNPHSSDPFSDSPSIGGAGAEDDIPFAKINSSYAI